MSHARLKMVGVAILAVLVVAGGGGLVMADKAGADKKSSAGKSEATAACNDLRISLQDIQMGHLQFENRPVRYQDPPLYLVIVEVENLTDKPLKVEAPKVEGKGATFSPPLPRSPELKPRKDPVQPVTTTLKPREKKVMAWEGKWSCISAKASSHDVTVTWSPGKGQTLTLGKNVTTRLTWSSPLFPPPPPSTDGQGNPLPGKPSQ